jgi:K(+)-stimulated pyrophosphate-energized sodium pump
MNFEGLALFFILGTSLLALIYAGFLARQILRQSQGNESMQKVAQAIRLGANVYLKRQFKIIAFITIPLTVALYFSIKNSGLAIGRSLAFLIGAIFSATVGFLGMNIATQANVRVAQAAKESFNKALAIAYRAGTITGMLTDGLGLLGGTVIFMLFREQAPQVLLGFGFGGTLLALFMRVGGGIYTKAADVGADLSGKLEQEVPEDDPRNAAVIADLVGDNVGDCAGMAADIFESYEVTIVSAMILGLALTPFDLKWILFPLLVRAVGVISSIIGTYAVSFWPTKEDAFKAMDLSYDLSSLISTLCFFALSKFYVHDLRVFWATAAGIILAITFNKLTGYFTHYKYSPVKEVVESARTGAATKILSGLSVGFESTVWAILFIALVIFACSQIFALSGVTMILYGISLAGIGMLSHTGNNVAMDAFGPIADNAGGIGEIAKLDKKTQSTLASLDSAGNTTKAITKGIAIASAVIAAVSLFGSFVETTGLQKSGLDIADPQVFIGMLIGGAIPFLFSALTIRSVSRASSLIVEEVRRQFKIPGLLQGKVEPNYARAVAICTTAAQKELINLGALAVLTPVVVGFLLHETALGGFLAGLILTGQLLAVFMANAGGTWDNAKKMIESGIYGGKGSDAHKAAIIGDTVGDPLKDTSGPALNPLIKVMNLVSLLIAPIIVAKESRSLLSTSITLLLLLVLIGAIWNSKQGRDTKQI